MNIIFSDVDKTMIDGNLNLLDATMLDIEKARSKGVLFTICTGNSHHENMIELAGRVSADFLITSDGARVYDCKLQKIIYKKMIAKDDANTILQKVRNHFSHVAWSTESQLHISVETEMNRKRAIEINKKYNRVSGVFAFENIVRANVYKMSCLGENKQKVDAAEAIIKKHNVSYLRHSKKFLTISAPGCNKGKAVLATSEMNNANPNDIMVVGDGANDLSMAKVTPNSYAVANAIDALKKIVNRHTSSVEQNGLGEAIVDFMFRKKIV